MSFVTTRPEALMAAASTLQSIGTSMATQNAAAAGATTGVVPAAVDAVSALQATQFAAYGAWYQQVSAQATAIHQALVNALGTNAGSYGETKAANRASTSTTSLSGVLGGLTAAAADPPGLSSSAGATIGTPLGWAQNFGAAASDLIQVAPAQSLADSGPTILVGDAGAGLRPDATGPAGSAGLGGAPVLASLGQAPSVRGLSVPPDWAVGAPAVNPTPATLVGAGWTGTAPQTASVTAIPAGVPAVASAGRGGLGLGMPRYGAKPTVMPGPAVV